MGAQLDPQAQALLEVMRAAGTPQPHTLSVEQARESMRAALLTKGAPLPLHSVSELSIPSPHGPLSIRAYRPSDGPLPLALFLHGGGWIVNDVDTHDRLCRRIAARSGRLIVSLEYRRAPEHRHPAALEDALMTYRWLLDNRERLGAEGSSPALVGESSGATTVAALSMLLRDLDAPLPCYQALAYPMTDLFGRWPSCTERASGYALDADFVLWSWRHAIAAEQAPDDPYLLPLRASDFTRLPATLVITAEFDPLRDEGIAYAQRLADAGVEVEHIHAADQMHGFLLVDRAVAKAGALIDRLADALAAHTPAAAVTAGH